MTIKSDKSIHGICIASIKRSTMNPYDFKWTKFYASNEEFFLNNPTLSVNISDNELIICSTIINDNQYSILTTRQLVTNENGVVKYTDIANAPSHKWYGDFKGYNKGEWTFGIITLVNDDEFKYYIETGKASMIMIYGVRTRIGMNGLTQVDLDKTIKRWTNRKLMD